MQDHTNNTMESVGNYHKNEIGFFKHAQQSPVLRIIKVIVWKRDKTCTTISSSGDTKGACMKRQNMASLLHSKVKSTDHIVHKYFGENTTTDPNRLKTTTILKLSKL